MTDLREEAQRSGKEGVVSEEVPYKREERRRGVS